MAEAGGTDRLADATALALALRAAKVHRIWHTRLLVAAGFDPLTAVRAAGLPGDRPVLPTLLAMDALLAADGGWPATLALAQALGVHPLAFATVWSPVARAEEAFARLGLTGRFLVEADDGTRRPVVAAACGTRPDWPERWRLRPGTAPGPGVLLALRETGDLLGLGAGDHPLLTARATAP